jgi:hypothetical protein
MRLNTRAPAKVSPENDLAERRQRRTNAPRVHPDIRTHRLTIQNNLENRRLERIEERSEKTNNEKFIADVKWGAFSGRGNIVFFAFFRQKDK